MTKPTEILGKCEKPCEAITKQKGVCVFVDACAIIKPDALGN